MFRQDNDDRAGNMDVGDRKVAGGVKTALGAQVSVELVEKPVPAPPISSPSFCEGQVKDDTLKTSC